MTARDEPDDGAAGQYRFGRDVVGQIVEMTNLVERIGADCFAQRHRRAVDIGDANALEAVISAADIFVASERIACATRGGKNDVLLCQGGTGESEGGDKRQQCAFDHRSISFQVEGHDCPCGERAIAGVY